MFKKCEYLTDRIKFQAYIEKSPETIMDLKQLGLRIRAARREAGLTQLDLSIRVGVSQSYIAKLENGDTDNPGLNVIMDIAREVDRSAAWLLYEHEDLEKLTKDSINLALMYEDMTEEQKEAMVTIAASFVPKKPPNGNGK